MALPREPVRRLRAILFFLLVTVAGLVVVVFELLLFPIVYFADPNRFLFHRMNAVLARACMWPFLSVEIQGLENLERGKATVFAANHQSALDAFLFAMLGHVNFKCTFKQAIAFYPGFGQAFLMAGHVVVKRGDKKSAIKVIAKCKDWLRRGVSILFFPEGTRKVQGMLGDFKSGAFRVASDTGVSVTPVTITGARSLMSPRGYPSLGWGKAVLTIHKPIKTEGKDYHDVMRDVRELILNHLNAVEKTD